MKKTPAKPAAKAAAKTRAKKKAKPQTEEERLALLRKRALRLIAYGRDPAVNWDHARKRVGFTHWGEFSALLRREDCADIQKLFHEAEEEREAVRKMNLKHHAYGRMTGEIPEPTLTNKGEVVLLHSTSERLLNGELDRIHEDERAAGVAGENPILLSMQRIKARIEAAGDGPEGGAP